MQCPSELLSVTLQALHAIFSLCKATFKIPGVSAKLPTTSPGGKKAPFGSPGAVPSVQRGTTRPVTNGGRAGHGDGLSECGAGGFLWLPALKMLSLLAPARSGH